MKICRQKNRHQNWKRLETAPCPFPLSCRCWSPGWGSWVIPARWKPGVKYSPLPLMLRAGPAASGVNKHWPTEYDQCKAHPGNWSYTTYLVICRVVWFLLCHTERGGKCGKQGGAIFKIFLLANCEVIHSIVFLAMASRHMWIYKSKLHFSLMFR